MRAQDARCMSKGTHVPEVPSTPQSSLSSLKSPGSQSHQVVHRQTGTILMPIGPSSSLTMSPGKELPCLRQLLDGNSTITYPGKPGFPPKPLTHAWRHREKDTGTHLRKPMLWALLGPWLVREATLVLPGSRFPAGQIIRVAG